MELRHLRYFVAVAEERHMTRAAVRLGIQQPPLSVQIRALETELGVSLFVRGARGVELTAAGRIFLKDVEAILGSVGRAAERVREAARGGVWRLSVGFTTSAVLHPLVPRMIQAFRQAYGEVELDLHEAPAANLIEAVMRREIQVALLRVPVDRPSGLAFVELAYEDLLAVLPVGHRLAARRGGVRLDDLRQERFILVRRPDAPGIYENVILACRAAGFEPVIGAEVAHMLTNINLVAAGAGVSFVPASMREVNLRQVVYVPLRVRPRLVVPLTLGYLTGAPDPVVRNFVAVARQGRAGVLDAAADPPAR
jgi:DNA-binding transcriptional LysR family regulator